MESAPGPRGDPVRGRVHGVEVETPRGKCGAFIYALHERPPERRGSGPAAGEARPPHSLPCFCGFLACKPERSGNAPHMLKKCAAAF